MDGFGGMMPGMMGPGLLGPGMLPPGLMGMGEFSYGGPGMGGMEGPGPKENFYKTRLCHNEDEMRLTTGDAEEPAETKLRGDVGEVGRGGSKTGPGQDPSPPLPPIQDYQKGSEGRNAAVRNSDYKTRLCTRFMQKGECSYGPTCHFAHGYEELRPDDLGSMPMDGPGFDLFRNGMMMGGGMMGMEFMMGGMPGMPGGMMPLRPRPPPGPPPPDLTSNSNARGTPVYSPDHGFRLDIPRTPTRLPTDVAYLERVKAMCALLGVGTIKSSQAGSDAVEAALASFQTGDAFRANVYADALDVI